LRILEAAAEEAEAAIAWYENERRGLGADFAGCIERALDLLEDRLIPLLPLPGESGRVGQGVSFSAAFHTVSSSWSEARN
jgi:hypothetical protein